MTKVMTINTMTPEERSLALMHVLGWQGGTIHQVAKATGCNSEDLLHAQVSHTLGESMGFSAARTCSLDFNQRVNFPNHQGDLAFWLGAAFGQYLHENGVPSFAKEGA